MPLKQKAFPLTPLFRKDNNFSHQRPRIGYFLNVKFPLAEAMTCKKKENEDWAYKTGLLKPFSCLMVNKRKAGKYFILLRH